MPGADSKSNRMSGALAEPRLIHRQDAPRDEKAMPGRSASGIPAHPGAHCQSHARTPREQKGATAGLVALAALDEVRDAEVRARRRVAARWRHGAGVHGGRGARPGSTADQAGGALLTRGACDPARVVQAAGRAETGGRTATVARGLAAGRRLGRNIRGCVRSGVAGVSRRIFLDPIGPIRRRLFGCRFRNLDVDPVVLFDDLAGRVRGDRDAGAAVVAAEVARIVRELVQPRDRCAGPERGGDRQPS
jgi:hypothetical protein